ncbi:MAG: hypothetical protein WBP13_09025 [Methylophilaceae bacterium]
MAANEPMMVSCGSHGERIAAVVCKHMLHLSLPAGFIENNSDPNDLQAWCHLCEEEFQRQGGMTDAFKDFNGMAVVCVVCYSKAKTHHAVSES